jgi:hypothetical protein
MGRERWGTFSVKDHTGDQPFVADVLMYDRLIIPRPPKEKRSLWVRNEWDPDRLDAIIDVLRADQEPAKQHAITVAWDDFAEGVFSQRAAAAHIVDQEVNYQLTRRLLTAELVPPAPAGAIPVSVVAAYTSAKAVEQDWVSERRESLTLAIAHEFLAPAPNDRPYLDNLKDAVALADDAEFQKKRAKMYQWQDDVIRTGLSNPDAIAELGQYIQEYNEATKRAVRDVYKKFAFTLIPIGLAFAGPLAPLAAVGNIANLVRFWIYDRHPKIQAGDSEVAAMFHDVRQELGWNA